MLKHPRLLSPTPQDNDARATVSRAVLRGIPATLPQVGGVCRRKEVAEETLRQV